jgi:hypothetical protein
MVGSLSSQDGLHHGEVVVHMEEREASAMTASCLSKRIFRRPTMIVAGSSNIAAITGPSFWLNAA